MSFNVNILLILGGLAIIAHIILTYMIGTQSEENHTEIKKQIMYLDKDITTLILKQEEALNKQRQLIKVVEDLQTSKRVPMRPRKKK